MRCSSIPKPNSLELHLVLESAHYFTSEIIEKRNPLPTTAKRAGWVGCNIDLSNIPSSGKIFLVQNGTRVMKDEVLSKWQNTAFLSSYKGATKGWLLDILKCVVTINSSSFTLNDMYAFSETLKIKHPENRHIKDKIRQQLQVLRDKGLIDFKGGGNYEKVPN